jgi:hypothetical protein
MLAFLWSHCYASLHMDIRHQRLLNLPVSLNLPICNGIAPQLFSQCSCWLVPHGALVWIIITVIILAIIGLGWQIIFSGIWHSAQKIGKNPIVQNLTNNAKASASEIITNATK